MCVKQKYEKILARKDCGMRNSFTKNSLSCMKVKFPCMQMKFQSIKMKYLCLKMKILPKKIFMGENSMHEVVHSPNTHDHFWDEKIMPGTKF